MLLGLNKARCHRIILSYGKLGFLKQKTLGRDSRQGFLLANQVATLFGCIDFFHA